MEGQRLCQDLEPPNLAEIINLLRRGDEYVPLKNPRLGFCGEHWQGVLCDEVVTRQREFILPIAGVRIEDLPVANVRID